jgi:hypothetical protein
MSRIAVRGNSMAAVVAVAALAVLLGSAGPAQSVEMLVPASFVRLDVHPNERAAGIGVSPKLGTEPWTSSGISGPFYEWKVYTFYVAGCWPSQGGSLYCHCIYIEVCAQAFNSLQNSCGQDDKLWMKLDGETPVALASMQTGPPGSYQWKGDLEHGNRKTLAFYRFGPDGWDALSPGAHTLKFYAKNTPIIWWVNVTEYQMTWWEVADPA